MSYIKIGKYAGNDPNADEYQFKEILDVDYVDSTDVYMWFEAPNFSKKDYLWCREQAMIYIQSIGGFSALTNDIHKELAVKNFCVGEEDRLSMFTLEEQEVFWFEFAMKSELCRSRRWDKAKSYASFRLSIVDSNDLAEVTMDLNMLYIKYGIDSFVKDGKWGLIDWLNSDGIYSDTGFTNKTYYNADIQTGILNILQRGY